MDQQEPCRLCQGVNTTLIFTNSKAREFYKCSDCDYIQVHRHFFISPEAEKQRYLLHKNNVESVGYQNFLKPVVDHVMQFETPDEWGLDYGSGPSSVIEFLLKKQNYRIHVFDPLFCNHIQTGDQGYDYVVCTEVVEHFKDPIFEFGKLLSFLKVDGSVYIKTGLTDKILNFSDWSYHRDSTHVGFFNEKSIRFMAQYFQFSLVDIAPQSIRFKR